MAVTFEGISADAAAAILKTLHLSDSIEDLAGRSGVSTGTARQILDVLSSEQMILDLSTARSLRKRALVKKIREASIFWNKFIMSQKFPQRLFGYEATKSEVLGWGIEHYFFVRAANEYMAAGASRIDGSTKHLSELWTHYAEEALHDEIFLNGLEKCGLSRRAIDNRPPLASTLALTNFLYEKSMDSALSYSAVFCVMQAREKPPTVKEIEDKYSGLRSNYDYASALFSAFEMHDKIDAEMKHSELTIEAIIEMEWPMSYGQVMKIFETIEQTANHFVLFFDGISNKYRSPRVVTYRQPGNAVGARFTTAPKMSSDALPSSPHEHYS
ncbi:iron-containing redox enzyme family protein [Bradyrhizobium sp. USDA 4350]